MLALTGTEKGKTVAGIYKIDGDRLVVCVRDAEHATKGRPEKFATTADGGLGLITLERVKK